MQLQFWFCFYTIHLPALGMKKNNNIALQHIFKSFNRAQIWMHIMFFFFVYAPVC